MKRKLLTLSAVLAGALSAGSVLADHNSPMGEGWANMPNDIHNTRIDTLGDNTAFRDFVQYGDGADSVNRFTDDTTTTSGSMSVSRTTSASSVSRGGARR